MKNCEAWLDDSTKLKNDILRVWRKIPIPSVEMVVKSIEANNHPLDSLNASLIAGKSFEEIGTDWNSELYLSDWVLGLDEELASYYVATQMLSFTRCLCIPSEGLSLDFQEIALLGYLSRRVRVQPNFRAFSSAQRNVILKLIQLAFQYCKLNIVYPEIVKDLQFLLKNTPIEELEIDS